MTGQTINPAAILLRLDWAEGEDLEFKSARGGLPKSLWKTYSAMANGQGGVILLGVEDDGRVCGVEEPRKLQKAFWDGINDRGQVNPNLSADTKLAEVAHPDGLILAIHVPRATRYQRPVFLGRNPLTGTYRRSHEGNYRCTEKEVSRMLSDRAEEPADSRVLEGFGIEDVDLPSLHKYRSRFRSHRPEHPWSNEGDLGLLTKLGGWRRDRDSGVEGLTLAGLLMFGRHESLLEGAPAYHVDYRERLSDDPAERWSDRLTADGMWHPNLFQFYTRVVLRLFADLKTPFRLDAELFRKEETEVHEAVREALVNALIHADYRGHGGVVVEKHRNAFEFSNPGSLLVSIEQMMDGNVSECRNKTLQTMFMLIGAAEKAGSGVDKIHRGWASQHWRLPLVQETFRPDRVRWQLPMVSLIPDESLAKLQELFGRRFEQFDQNEVQALVTADVEGAVDNSRMRRITGLHAADVTRLLQGLVARNALVQEGRGRWSRYRLSGRPERAGAGAEPGTGLRDIAARARSRSHLKREEMQGIILALCRDRWLTRKQLAALLDRHPDGLRQRFLNPMVNQGLLVLRYAHAPNRADQAYSSTSSGQVRERPGLMPTCWIIAGPNGAGKTTFALEYLPQMADGIRFVNADLIAAGLSPLAPERELLAASRVFLREIKACVAARTDFAFETTLAGRTHLRLVDRLKADGWRVSLTYLALSSVEMSMRRVAERVAHGGHGVPEADIRRRFPRSLRHLLDDFSRRVDRCACFVNDCSPSELVFMQRGGDREVVRPDLYDLLLRESER